MKRVLRSLALATLGLYVGLLAVETFHSHSKDHSESKCAICTVAHQTPAAAQSRPILARPTVAGPVETGLVASPDVVRLVAYDVRGPPAS